MKKLLSFICVAMFTIAASAQVTWNAKGGIGVATCYGSDIEGAKSHFVSKLGAGLEYPFSSNWSLMPSLEFALKGEGAQGESADFYYMQIPVVLAYRLNLTNTWNMALKAGPYFAYMITNNLEDDEWVKKFDAGIDAGIDFEHHRFVFGVEVECGFLNLIDQVSVKNLAFYATVGWKF